jgi:signal transduction histidine kinase
VTTLRVRLAALLVVAIVAVVGLATLVAVLVIGPPGRDRPIRAMAAQVRVLHAFAAAHPGAAAGPPVPGLVAQPPGDLDEPMTAALRRALASDGTAVAAEVRRVRTPPALLLAVPAGEAGFLLVPLDDRPPPAGGWLILAGWMATIVVGVAGVALVGARRLTRPLALLEDAVAGVGADGALPVLPETGPAEVRATAAALNRLSERLQAAVASRMRLVAAAGHDLRTPITRLRLRAEFLPDAERATWLADLEELERIADSAIELVREEAGGGGEPVHLDALATEVVAELAALGLPAVLEAAEPVVVAARPLALKRALRNLVANAATHGGGARVRVAAPAGSPGALLTIEDDGPGIPPEQVARAFEPFFRVDPARRRSAPGAGLGLAIAREIVTRAGGEIRLANRPAGGLRQEVVLPLARGVPSPGSLLRLCSAP